MLTSVLLTELDLTTRDLTWAWTTNKDSECCSFWLNLLFLFRWSLSRLRWFGSSTVKASSTSSSTSLWAESFGTKWGAKQETPLLSLPSFSMKTSTVGWEDMCYHLTHEVVDTSLQIFSHITKVLIKMQPRVELNVCWGSDCDANRWTLNLKCFCKYFIIQIWKRSAFCSCWSPKCYKIGKMGQK